MASRGIKLNILASLLAWVVINLPLHAQHLQEGDLLFACSDTANAITDVTSGIDKLPIDHVAVVHRIGGHGGPLYVIEAVKPTVCLTALDAFMRENGRVLHARVNAQLDTTASIRRCLRLVGRPYDDLYLPGDSAVYCSELVQMSYVDRAGTLIFDPVPMSFHDQTGQVTEYWLEFYRHRGMAVPEGAPGTNPGELSRRPQVTVLGFYSLPDKKTGAACL